jgi:hypothetical protein
MSEPPPDEQYALCEILHRVTFHILEHKDIDREVVRLLMIAISNIPDYLRSGNADYGIQVQHDIDDFDDALAKSRGGLCLRDIYDEALITVNGPK